MSSSASELPDRPPRTAEDDTRPIPPGTEGTHGGTDSEPPPPADILFANHLTAAGRLDALDQRLLRSLSRQVQDTDDSRHFKLAHQYFLADGDAAESLRRRITDRYLPVYDAHQMGSSAVTQALEEINPELAGLSLERIGGSDGPVVFRWGEHVSAVIDEYDEDLETNEVDLRELDAQPTVTVRAMVRAVNRLLGRAAVETRMVLFFHGEGYEAYLGLAREWVIQLRREGFMDDESESDLLDFGGWAANV